ncbi:hypothetical protein SAMD00019534_120650 [Acytostelium subglobosum LB1]|uniref:hypothetical protein n=1 Tax=Acytostelium subglobosum LB1 TaxID=1410327 RepID=UPI00064509AF|nr:hypothetical protein SAMD00019534_120650 [Acytostelium subglobosum LB1]GAM28889.1 hypothetical protein SAMD00019534_120650 [Acytostelium subglobosum LB1]|eukprot:XP_012748074.1 hypothetical protein SAMD00019534_120650 [Acytostelium subglobosum LB1]
MMEDDTKPPTTSLTGVKEHLQCTGCLSLLVQHDLANSNNNDNNNNTNNNNGGDTTTNGSPTIESILDTNEYIDIGEYLDDPDSLRTELQQSDNGWQLFYNVISCDKNHLFQSVLKCLQWCLGAHRHYDVLTVNESLTALTLVHSSHANADGGSGGGVGGESMSPDNQSSTNIPNIPPPPHMIYGKVGNSHTIIFDEQSSILRIPLFGQVAIGEIKITPFTRAELPLLTQSKLIRFLTKRSSVEMERIKYEELLNFFVEYSCASSNEHFHSLTKYLCYYLDANYAMVCQFIPPDTGMTLSFCRDGVIQKNMEYQLPGTPCYELHRRKPVYYSNNLIQAFPEDKWLEDNGIESYLGIPLMDSTGEMLGHLTVMSNKTINSDIIHTSLMAAVANKITMELERRKVSENFAVTKELLNQFPSTSVILTDSSGKISRTFGEQLFEFHGKELFNQSIDKIQSLDIQTAQSSNDSFQPLSTMVPTSEPSREIKREIVCIKKTNNNFPAEVFAKDLTLNEKSIGRMYVIRDITETRNNQRVLVEARDRALQAIQMKTQFMASISHEIRTPMNAVIGLSEILLSSNLPPSQMSIVEVLHKAAELLYSITSDILDFQKIEASKLELEILEFDFRGCIEGIVHTLSLSLDKPIELLLTFDDHIPKILKGDPNRIRQILLNIGQNSIKYTNSGHIFIDIALSLREGNRCEVTFTVEDTGIGIDDSQKNKLFQPFLQLDSGTTRRYGGSGLGLAICKKMVDLMGGKIGLVKSAPNRGSTFSFTIVLEDSQMELAAGPPAEPAEGKTELSACRIMLVDDYGFGRNILIRKLHQDISSCSIQTLSTDQLTEIINLNDIESIANVDLFILVERDCSSDYDFFSISHSLSKLTEAKIVLATNQPNHDQKRTQFFVLHKPLSSNQVIKVLESVGVAGRGGGSGNRLSASNSSSSIGSNSSSSSTSCTSGTSNKRRLEECNEEGGESATTQQPPEKKQTRLCSSQTYTSTASTASTSDSYELLKNIGGSAERRLNYKILLAEDNEVNRKVVSLQLKKLGFHCDCAVDGKEAVEMFKGGNYDLIFMDLTMPNTDGPTASLQIRSHEEIFHSRKKVTIVALTAMVLEGSKDYCKSMGMDGMYRQLINN